MSDNSTSKFVHMLKALNSSLRLKDVLESVVMQFSELGANARVAVFLADNDSLSLKLMNARGYSEASIEQIRVLSFQAESLLKNVVQKRQAMYTADVSVAPDLSAAVMTREGSKGQIGLPLIASNLLVGAVLMDVVDLNVLEHLDLLKSLAEISSQAIANAILFGRSEYERDRLGTLYKTSLALGGSSLKIMEVIQIAADTSLILANTPHCAVLMIDPSRSKFNVAAVKGLDGNSLAHFDLALEDTLAGRAVVAGRTEYAADATSVQMALPRSTGGGLFGSSVAVPVAHEQDVIGVLMLFSVDIRAFHREQIELLESLAKQVGTALNIAMTHESVSAQTVQDAHTGLYNHWHFNESLGRELERSIRHKHEFSILRLDIDHLSRVNELLGPLKGDEAIKHVARIIKNTLRDIDIPCRYGSQEFAVLLPETPRKNAAEVAERLRQRIRAEAAPGVGMVTISIGMASFPETGEEPVVLLKAAEQALDVAKFEGRDRVKLAETGGVQREGVSWDELARQAKLAVLSERQTKLQTQSRLSVDPEYAPWMRAVPAWGKKKSDVAAGKE